LEFQQPLDALALKRRNDKIKVLGQIKAAGEWMLILHNCELIESPDSSR
jgi:hypothetical protein